MASSACIDRCRGGDDYACVCEGELREWARARIPRLAVAALTVLILAFDAALRPRARFKGRSPAAVVLRCGAVLALLALGGCEQLIVLHPKGVVADGTTSLLIGAFVIMLPIVVPT